MPMLKVLKFGGTSVGTVESLRNVKAIVERLDRPAIVVVSALGGLTDKLISTARSASRGETDYLESMSAIRSRHYDIIEEMVPAERRDEVLDHVSGLLDDLENRYHGLSLILDLPERTLDEIVSFGERMSSVIVAAMLSEARHHDSLGFIKTEKWFNRNIADRTLTETLIKEELGDSLDCHAVVGGFISTDRDSGDITNLGRGGSDYTAALIAASLNAASLEIWTDVDGFLTADPRIIPDARIIPEMSFVESMELCSFGAKVIYPPTIYPVFHKNIPIRILNTFNPEAPGTVISDNIVEKGKVRGVSSVSNTAVVTIEGPLTVNVAEVNSRAYNAMARQGISVFLVSQPSPGHSFSIAMLQSECKDALRQLSLEFAADLRSGNISLISAREGLSVVAVVGEGIRQVSGLGSELVAKLQRSGIEVPAVSDGASETTIAVVVDSGSAKDALRIVHEACFCK